MRVAPFVLAALIPIALAGCKTKTPPPTPDPTPAPAPTPSAAPTGTAEGALRLGVPIEASAEKVALADVAKTPTSYVGKTFATTGTVTAVCQHMGCWMEIKDDASAAHIKMAGHAFFVPKTASGRKARVLAKLGARSRAEAAPIRPSVRLGRSASPAASLARISRTAAAST